MSADQNSGGDDSENERERYGEVSSARLHRALPGVRRTFEHASLQYGSPLLCDRDERVGEESGEPDEESEQQKSEAEEGGCEVMKRRSASLMKSSQRTQVTYRERKRAWRLYFGGSGTCLRGANRVGLASWTAEKESNLHPHWSHA